MDQMDKMRNVFTICNKKGFMNMTICEWNLQPKVLNLFQYLVIPR